MVDQASTLLRKHRDLDYLCRHPGNRIFVSDWYCNHPFAREFLADESHLIDDDTDLLYYCFQNDTRQIHEEIRKFHLNNDGIAYDYEEIFVGAGTTALLTAQMLLLVSRNVRRVWYTRPLYYTFYYFARLFGIELAPVCDVPLNVPGIKLTLPNERTWLVICDPIWFMGKPILTEYMDQITRWQVRTGSHIMVDGAFQYMKWRANDRFEASSRFDRSLTFRTLCPTKCLALHGIRFSYTLLPRQYQEDMRYAYANSSGSSCVFSHKAGKRLMEVLNTPESNHGLIEYIKHKYMGFSQRDLFLDDLGAEATYFIFVRMKGDLDHYITMDQDFFDTTNYPGYVRFNLLLPHPL